MHTFSRWTNQLNMTVNQCWCFNAMQMIVKQLTVMIFKYTIFNLYICLLINNIINLHLIYSFLSIIILCICYIYIGLYISYALVNMFCFSWNCFFTMRSITSQSAIREKEWKPFFFLSSFILLSAWFLAPVYPFPMRTESWGSHLLYSLHPQASGLRFLSFPKSLKKERLWLGLVKLTVLTTNYYPSAPHNQPTDHANH